MKIQKCPLPLAPWGVFVCVLYTNFSFLDKQHRLHCWVFKILIFLRPNFYLFAKQSLIGHHDDWMNFVNGSFSLFSVQHGIENI